MMEESVAMFDTAKTLNSYLSIANRFERIAAKEKKEWLPRYYAAYAYIIANYLELSKKQRDLMIDKAVSFTAKADSLSPDNVEITLIKAYIYQARLSVKPASRGREYGIKSYNMLEIAHQRDSTNPRYDFLKGQDLFYTPPMFGGGADKAKPYLENALKKYDNFVPESSIHPNWGKKRTELILSQCSEK